MCCFFFAHRHSRVDVLTANNRRCHERNVSESPRNANVPVALGRKRCGCATQNAPLRSLGGQPRSAEWGALGPIPGGGPELSLGWLAPDSAPSMLLMRPQTIDGRPLLIANPAGCSPLDGLTRWWRQGIGDERSRLRPIHDETLSSKDNLRSVDCLPGDPVDHGKLLIRRQAGTRRILSTANLGTQVCSHLVIRGGLFCGHIGTPESARVVDHALTSPAKIG